MSRRSRAWRWVNHPPMALQRLVWFAFISLAVVYVDYASAERREASKRNSIALCDKANLGRASLIVSAEHAEDMRRVIFLQRINPISDCAYSQYVNDGRPVALTGERLQRYLDRARALYPPPGEL